MPALFTLKVIKAKSMAHEVAVSPTLARIPLYVRLDTTKQVYACSADERVPEDCIALPDPIRSALNIGVGHRAQVFDVPNLDVYPVAKTLTVYFIGSLPGDATHTEMLFDMALLNENERIVYSASCFFFIEDTGPVHIKKGETVLTFKQGTVTPTLFSAGPPSATPKAFSSIPPTASRETGPSIGPVTQAVRPSQTQQPLQIDRIDISKLDVGGLSTHIDTLFQRVLLSRCLPQTYLDRIGLKHVKGVVLYGPPGCGKTLMVRQLALNVLKIPQDQITVINGPELMNKFVGSTEENIRRLFEPAEKHRNKTYVLIFDEFDALARKRGRGDNAGSDLNDKIVNTLLTKLDGVESIDNILVFALTNRLELLDDALLRPGRFEVHLYIGLPDRVGREEILKIHTRNIAAEGFFDTALVPELARSTENFSGAELEGMVKNTVSSVLRRHVSMGEISKGIEQLTQSKVPITLTLADFLPVIANKGVGETTFPVRDLALLERTAVPTLALDFSKEKQLIVFHGLAKGRGKTMTAGFWMHQSGFSYTAYLSARHCLGKTSAEKQSMLVKVNNPDMPVGLLVLDDVDTLIGYAPPSYFDNDLVQTIKTIATDRHHVLLICKRLDVLLRLYMIDNATQVVDFDQL